MTVYDEAFFDVIRDGSRRSAEAVVPLVMAELWPVRTVLDVGCGEGWWGKAFEAAGCRVTGVDGPGTVCQLEKFVPLDLATQRIPRIYPVFDLVVCLEVAEHLPADAAARLVEDLCNLSSVVLFSAAIPGQGGTNHCFPGDTVVSGFPALGGTARRYEGALVELAFASGHLLTVTPNHPVLTEHGWVAAGRLSEGDDVVRCLDAQRIAAGVPHEYQAPSLIQDVFASLDVMDDASGVPVAAEDFHGDGKGSEVAIVRTDGNLRDRRQSSLVQPGGEFMFSRGGMGTSLLARPGLAGEGLRGTFAATRAGNQGIDDSLAALRAAPVGGEPVRFGTTSHRSVSGGEVAPDGCTPDPELVRYLFGSHPGLVELDYVSSVRWLHGSDLVVYNLETAVNWYSANGIIAHNCNEQWPAYWADLFEARRYRCSGALRWRIWDDPNVEPWYKQNLFVFAHDSAVQANEAIFFGPAAGPIPVVHPAFWEDRLSWGAA